MAFNVNRIVSAIVQSHAAAWQVVLIEERVENPKADADKMLASIVEGIGARVNAGELDAESAKVYASHARTLMLCKLDTLVNAAALGHGINGLCKRIREAEGNRGKGGRPAGQGKGKTTAAPVDAAPAEATAELPADDRQWKMVLEGMIARIPGRKDWSMDDINAYRDCASKMIALLQRNSK